jgi:glycerophosphoryl diester phosphodiesterase
MALPSSFLTTPLAHRGLHDAASRRPENALSAFRAAVAAGYGIELDVQVSADGEAMVFHDDTLDRMTAEAGPLAARTAAELGRITLTNSDDRIPTLSQVLQVIAGRVPLLIELKDAGETLGPTDGRLEQAVARALAGYAGPVAVMSFNPHQIIALRTLAPAIPRGLTTDAFEAKDWPHVAPESCARLAGIPDYDATGASFLSHHFRDLARPRVRELQAKGAAILCWTIRSPEQEAEARRIAQNITFEGYRAALTA